MTMRKRIIATILITCALAITGIAMADGISINKEDTITTVLTAQIGKRITVRIKSGQELSGKVTAVTNRLTHLSELVGQEFYDAVVVNKSIEAVIIRTK